MRLLLLRLYGIRVNRVSPTLVRITVPRKRAERVGEVAKRIASDAWLDGKHAEIQQDGDVTVLVGPTARVEIRPR